MQIVHRPLSCSSIRMVASVRKMFLMSCGYPLQLSRNKCIEYINLYLHMSSSNFELQPNAPNQRAPLQQGPEGPAEFAATPALTETGQEAGQPAPFPGRQLVHVAMATWPAGYYDRQRIVEKISTVEGAHFTVPKKMLGVFKQWQGEEGIEPVALLDKLGALRAYELAHPGAPNQERFEQHKTKAANTGPS